MTTRHRSLVGRVGRKVFVRDKGLAHIEKIRNAQHQAGKIARKWNLHVTECWDFEIVGFGEDWRWQNCVSQQLGHGEQLDSGAQFKKNGSLLDLVLTLCRVAARCQSPVAATRAGHGSGFRTCQIDWCCVYYFVRNSLVALLEALRVQNLLWIRDIEGFFFGLRRHRSNKTWPEYSTTIDIVLIPP